jgi:addiction module RelB/DinJ family antitoxin
MGYRNVGVFYMAETRLNVRVDNNTKKQAEAVFAALGMNMSTGINIFLAQVARSRAIPFALELDGDSIECRMREAVNAKISAVTSSGSPVALYDDLQKRPFLEYPDGRRVYDIG